MQEKIPKINKKAQKKRKTEDFLLLNSIYSFVITSIRYSTIQRMLQHPR